MPHATFKPHLELLAIAEKAHAASKRLRDGGKRHPSYAFFGFEARELDMVSLDYAISAMEAYLNHIGFIFIPDWPLLAKASFWTQFETIQSYLVKFGIDLAIELINPFKPLRDKRNKLHHVHGFMASYQDRPHNEATQSAFDIEAKDAESAISLTKNFIEKTRVLFQLKLNEKPDLASLTNQILQQDPSIKLRQDLLDQMLENGV